jgi:glucose/mannose-6-phosphate isomerase
MSEPTTSIPSKAPSLVELADALDNEGMIGYTRAFVQDFRQGLNHVSLERFDWMNQLANKKWAGILCLGMGGSAAGGEFLSALTSIQGTIPVQVQRDYTLPAWWNPTWLIVATSHSGNTEETLESTETGLKSGATVVVISTGGILAGLPELYTNCYLVPSIGGQPPRSAFGHIFSRQLGLLRHLGVLPMPHDGADEAMLQRLQKAMDGFDLPKRSGGRHCPIGDVHGRTPHRTLGTDRTHSRTEPIQKSTQRKRCKIRKGWHRS